ncbi:MAG: pyruvate kinase [Clostridiales bacterium]|nr:pyruvate kinase [Candidatus Cacconaster stercorequi]
MKTYATLGPACMDQETLCDMLRAGLTGFRLNLSHTALAECEDWLHAVSAAAGQTGTHPELIIDMRGGELRTGKLARPITLQEGDTVTFGRDGLPLDDDILAALTVGQDILVDDDTIRLTVASRDGQSAACRCTRGGVLGSQKGITLPGITLERPAVSPEDHADFALAGTYGITGIMQPFVRSRRDLVEVRQAMAQHGIADLMLFAKVEDETGLKNLPDWMALCDVVTIARGDLGSNLPLWTLPRVQKEIAAICRQSHKSFLVVTQLLASMVSHPVPTRAEVSDIYNACLDGADALMLTNETAQGRYPAQSVEWLLRVAREGEAHR